MVYYTSNFENFDFLSYATMKGAWKGGFPTRESWGIFSGEQVWYRESSGKVSA